MRTVQDKFLPPDHDAFVAAEPPTGRIIVIAPTRAACETIELALGLHIPTLLETQHGEEIRALAAAGKGFGIVAGTGTGKTLSIRPISETILHTDQLRVGVVNREREATPETPTWNVIVVTTGIARRWFQDGDILRNDTLVVDEIHQTSAELELCLALGKRVGCRFIWLSATVDPTFYANYLDAAEVLESYAFDPSRAADVKVVRKDPLEFLDDRFLLRVIKQRRGVGMFLPTRAGVEEAARIVESSFPKINTAYYHGGEPIRVIRPFLESEEKKPYFLAMTAAGQSALNVRGLDTVVIDDSRFGNIIERGKNVLTRMHLGANEILQMAGRVHGRVAGGRVFILSDRDIQFDALRPTAPEFQLAGDSERVAMTCADLGVDARDLELPVPLDRVAYRQAVELLEKRGIIENGRLSHYGKLVEALPVDRPWAELLVNADDVLVPYLSVMSSIESLHRMTREERDLTGLIVPGSDHLTAYNLYAEAYTRCGYVGEVYGLERHLFDDRIEQWAERRGVLVKAIEDAALGMASVYRALEMRLPDKMSVARDLVEARFTELLSRFMPFDLVIDEETADGTVARVSKTSVAGSWGAIAGELRYFADKSGNPRAAIEGTQIPMRLIRDYATRGAIDVAYDPKRKGGQLVLTRTLEYFGFELEREVEVLDAFPDEILPRARRALADALAGGEARHPSAKRNRAAIETVREVYRRSGGITPKLGFAELSSWYERQLGDVRSMDDFRNARINFNQYDFITPEEREKYLALPSTVEIRDREVDVDYDIDKRGGESIPVARLRLPEKLARSIVDAELPVLDRPLRFVVIRGQRGAIRADSLDELQEILERPWSPDEIEEEAERPRHGSRPDRKSKDLARARRGRADGRADGRGRKPRRRFRGR
ncbi:MAG TPA: DEAD/DEAH box helicase [Gemmatimonadaceae bacterium]|jgi:ATP-dependent helicase HrpA|nr:DEAD/DEAH box helicase [Gemmatimonadaceae bacterium]